MSRENGKKPHATTKGKENINSAFSLTRVYMYIYRYIYLYMVQVLDRYIIYISEKRDKINRFFSTSYHRRKYCFALVSFTFYFCIYFYYLCFFSLGRIQICTSHESSLSYSIVHNTESLNFQSTYLPFMCMLAHCSCRVLYTRLRSY